jgi:hypothetical protein
MGRKYVFVTACKRIIHPAARALTVTLYTFVRGKIQDLCERVIKHVFTGSPVPL